MSEASKTILDIKNLDISFKTNAGVVHAIRGVNLDLCKGETVTIVGESGSGKSVTMKAAMGLLDSNATVNSGESSCASRSTASASPWCFRTP